MDEKDLLPGEFDTSLFSIYEEVAEDFLTATRYSHLDEDERREEYENMSMNQKWSRAFTEYNRRSDGDFLTPEEWVSYIHEQVGDVRTVATTTETGWNQLDGEKVALPEPSVSPGGGNVSLRAFVEGNYASGFHYHGPLFEDDVEEGEFPETVEEAVKLDDLDTTTGDIDTGFTDYVKDRLGHLPHTSRDLVHELHESYRENHSLSQRLTRTQFAEQLEQLFDVEINYEPPKGKLHRTVPKKDLLPVVYEPQDRRWPWE
ncbi:MAG: hypothetical protein ABEJ99_04325 [Candidatus Nanohaloarchaea archaeon]